MAVIVGADSDECLVADIGAGPGRALRLRRVAHEPARHARGTAVDLRRRARAHRRRAGAASGRSTAARAGAHRGEMARRAEELKGLVQPVQEKLGRMESEIGRLERERRQAQGELAKMVRTLGDGVGTLRQETGNLVSCAEAPRDARLVGRDPAAQRGRDGRHGRALRLRRAEHDRRRGRPLRPDMLVRLPGGKLIVVDSKVPLDAYLVGAGGGRRGRARAAHRAPRAPDARAHHEARREGLSRAARSTPELVVMFVPSDGIYQAALAGTRR